MSDPSDFYPELTRDRLSVVVSLIVNARRDCAALRQAKRGDTSWVAGCRGFQWSCMSVTLGTNEHDWLGVVEGGRIWRTDAGELKASVGLKFVFSVGGTPLRFYRGRPGKPPYRTLRVSHEELRIQQSAFRFMSSSEGRSNTPPHALRLAVEIDDQGEVERITLVEVLDAEGKRLGECWPIYGQTSVDNVAPMPTRKEEGTQLGKPSVGSRKKKSKEERGKG